MLKKLPKIIVIFFLTIFVFQMICLFFFLAAPAASQAADPATFKPQVQIPGMEQEFGSVDSKGYVIPGSTAAIAKYIRVVYKYAIGIVGILAAVVLMIGGVIWIVAGGNATMVGEAKAWIGASLTGLILALASYLILATVNPALVDLKTTEITKVEVINSGRCLTASLSNDPLALYTCVDNYTEEQCVKDNSSNKWEKGVTCPTPCCAWEQDLIATGLCKMQGGCTVSNLYVSCDDTNKTLTRAECNNKSGQILGAAVIAHSFKENGKCNKYTFMGTNNVLTSYECVAK